MSAWWDGQVGWEVGHTTMKTIFRVAMSPNTISYRPYKPRMPKRCLSNIEVNLRTKLIYI